MLEPEPLYTRHISNFPAWISERNRTHSPFEPGAAAAAGEPETNYRDRPHSFKVMAPARTVGAYARVTEEPAASPALKP